MKQPGTRAAEGIFPRRAWERGSTSGAFADDEQAVGVDVLEHVDAVADSADLDPVHAVVHSHAEVAVASRSGVGYASAYPEVA